MPEHPATEALAAALVSGDPDALSRIRELSRESVEGVKDLSPFELIRILRGAVIARNEALADQIRFSEKITGIVELLSDKCANTVPYERVEQLERELSNVTAQRDKLARDHNVVLPKSTRKQLLPEHPAIVGDRRKHVKVSGTSGYTPKRGRLPFGFKFEGDRMVEDEKESRVFYFVQNLRDSNMSWAEVVTAVTEKQFLSATGALWNKPTIAAAFRTWKLRRSATCQEVDSPADAA
jgi:hypothetical protein